LKENITWKEGKKKGKRKNHEMSWNQCGFELKNEWEAQTDKNQIKVRRALNWQSTAKTNDGQNALDHSS